MKKLYAVVFLLIATSLVGCGNKNLDIPNPEMTGDVQELEMTGDVQEIEITGDVQELEMTGDVKDLELTGDLIAGPTQEEMESFDATGVNKVAGSDEAQIKNSWVAQIKKLIAKRNTQAKDDAKLTEEDIDLMQKVIDSIK